MAQNTENTRPQYVEPAEIAEIETTRSFPFADVQDWQDESGASEMQALSLMVDEDPNAMDQADRAAWVLANAGQDERSGRDVEDQVTDMVADLLHLLHRDRPGLDALRVLANALAHMQTEIHPDGEDDPLYVTSVMSTNGDGWEIQLHDGRVVRLVVQG